jgi:hypothetical protein
LGPERGNHRHRAVGHQSSRAAFCLALGSRPNQKQKKHKKITTSAYLTQVNADSTAGAILVQSSERGAAL